MDREQLILALAQPQHKSREPRDGPGGLGNPIQVAEHGSLHDPYPTGRLVRRDVLRPELRQTGT
jgi:hypothetical protein